MTDVLAVVPVTAQVAPGPGEPLALQLLAGRSLLAHAVKAVLDVAADADADASWRITRVLVLAQPELVEPARSALLVEACPGSEVSSRVAVEPWSLDAVADAAGPCPVVLVHDPCGPLAPSAVVAAVLDALVAGAGARKDAEAGPGVSAGAVAVRPVTDTLKEVDEGNVVRATADRAGYGEPVGPQAYRTPVLLAALGGLTAVNGAAPLEGTSAPAELAVLADPAALCRQVAAAGTQVLAVPAEHAPARIRSEMDVLLAEELIGGVAARPA